MDKKFQLADWRIRPLGPEMLEYAMDDVRHLSELFHKMKADLLSKGNANLNLLRSVYDASNDLCKFRYEKPSINNQTSYLESLNRSRASLNSRQVRNFIHLDNFPFLGQYHRGHIYWAKHTKMEGITKLKRPG